MSPIRVVALSTCPVAGLVWRRAGEGFRLTVICRATFVLRPGRAVLVPRQHLPVAGDRGYPDGIRGEVYAPSDLVPRKARVDVLVVGAARGAQTRIEVGALDKRAPGPARPTRGPQDWQGYTLAGDLDLNVAPPDQTLDALRGDERLVLSGLHPEHAHLETQLPGLGPIALLEGPGARVRRLPLHADTLWIDASQGIGALVYRGEIELARGVPRAVLVDVEVPSSARRLQATAGVSTEALRQAALPFLGGAAPPPAPPPMVPVAAPLPPPMVPVAAPLPAADAPGASPWVSGLIASRPVEAPIAAVVPVLAARPVAEVEAPRGPSPRLDLLWFEPGSAPRVWREATFRSLLLAMEQRLPEAEELIAGDVADREDRRDLLEVLARGEPLSPAGVRRALGRSAREDGRLSPPLSLLAGELGVSFDPRERLKALVSALTPQAGHEAIKAEIEAARAFLAARGVGHGAGVCALLADRLRAAAATLPEKERTPDLDGEVDRGLLDARAFPRRPALGGIHVRTTLAVGGERLAAYLPKELAERLPRALRLPVRAIVAVHPGVDPRESPALRPIALAIVGAR